MKKRKFLVVTGAYGSGKTAILNALEHYDSLPGNPKQRGSLGNVGVSIVERSMEESEALFAQYGDDASWLLVINAVSAFTEREKKFFGNWDGKKAENLFVVFTQADFLPPEERQKFETRIRHMLNSVFLRYDGTFDEDLYRNRVFFASARRAEQTPAGAGVSRTERYVNAQTNAVPDGTGLVPLRNALMGHLCAWDCAAEFLARELKMTVEDSAAMSDVLCDWRYADILAKYHTSGEETVVTFCGGFNAGKSTLINRVLGAEILPTKFTTATAVVTRIEYGNTFEVCVERCGVCKRVSEEQAHREILYADGQDLDVSAATIVRYALPCPLLKNGVVFVDTPGIGDHEELTKISLRELEKSTLCVMVFTAERFNKLSDRQLYMHLNQVVGGNVVFVVNKCDLVHTPQEFHGLLDYEKTSLKDFGNRLVGGGTVFNTCCKDRDKPATELDGLDRWMGEKLPRLASRLRETAHEARLGTCLTELGRALVEEYSALSAVEAAEKENIAKKANCIFQKAQTKISKLRRRLSAFQLGQIEQLWGTYGYISQTLASYKDEFNRAMLQKSSMTASDTFEWKKNMLIRMIFPAFFENMSDAFHEEFSGNPGLWEGLPCQLCFPALPDAGSLVLPDEIPKADSDKSSYGWLFGSVCYLIGSFDPITDAVKNKLIPRSESILRRMFENLEEQLRTMEKAVTEDNIAGEIALMWTDSSSVRMNRLKETYQTVEKWNRRFEEGHAMQRSATDDDWSDLK
ncbi:GTPase Era [bioreactor metagenome]|uniref:GTPase Era n=1 Tax=bioreactor metagenome TaxID=1076179 RepID=A0A644WRI3_9ZZZZ